MIYDLPPSEFVLEVIGYDESENEIMSGSFKKGEETGLFLVEENKSGDAGHIGKNAYQSDVIYIDSKHF